jgi:hypothetical protein
MPREKTTAEPRFGFLSALDSPDYGHFGGYLIVSALGRPLEFHCTSPVRPSRAQEILYGPTLQSYLIGEQISSALLKAANTGPCLILVDVAAMLIARSVANSPMALISQQLQADRPTNGAEGDVAQDLGAGASSRQSNRIVHSETQIEAGGYSLILPSGFDGEKHTVAELATLLSQYVDLAEPFDRIHEAIREAQRIGGRAGDSNFQAA